MRTVDGAVKIRSLLSATNEMLLNGSVAGRCESCEALLFAGEPALSTESGDVRTVEHVPDCRLLRTMASLEEAVAEFGGRLQRTITVLSPVRAAVVLVWLPA